MTTPPQSDERGGDACFGVAYFLRRLNNLEKNDLFFVFFDLKHLIMGLYLAKLLKQDPAFSRIRVYRESDLQAVSRC